METEPEKALVAVETAFFAAVWLAGCFAALCRSVWDGSYRDLWHVLGGVLFSGCLGFSLVSVCRHHFGGSLGDGPYWLGVAVAIGLLGKEKELILRHLWQSLFKRLGIEIDEDETDEAPR